MGIYDSGISLDIGPERRRLVVYAALTLVALLSIAAVAMLGAQAISPQPMEFRFEKNPVKGGETAKVFITVRNVSEKDALNVPLSLAAKEETEFNVFAQSGKFGGTIPEISKGTGREVAFVVNPVGKVLPGTYTLVAKTTINGKEYEKEAVLTVE